MKPMFVSTVLLASAIGILGQGSVNFNNRATSGSPAPVVAPIFGVDPIEPLAPRFGNPATYAVAPVPAGTQTYGGAPLVGTGWTAELWAANAQLLDDQMVPISQTTFRVTTNPSLMGFVQPPALAPIVPGVAPGTSDRAKFELRVWDNRGGTITSWAQALSYRPFIAAASSGVFILDAPLGGGTATPPNLIGLQSFQMFSVPEPSTFAIGALAIVSFLIIGRATRSAG